MEPAGTVPGWPGAGDLRRRQLRPAEVTTRAGGRPTRSPGTGTTSPSTETSRLHRLAAMSGERAIAHAHRSPLGKGRVNSEAERERSAYTRSVGGWRTTFSSRRARSRRPGRVVIASAVAGVVLLGCNDPYNESADTSTTTVPPSTTSPPAPTAPPAEPEQPASPPSTAPPADAPAEAAVAPAPAPAAGATQAVEPGAQFTAQFETSEDFFDRFLTQVSHGVDPVEVIGRHPLVVR